MTLYYSKSAGGFFGDGINPPDQIPADAVEITAQQHDDLMRGQASGQVIVAGTAGVPTLAAPPPPNLFVYANMKQWALATGGYTVTIGGVARTFSTDGNSRGLLDGKVSRLGQANPPATVNWQFGAAFVQIPAADFLVIAVEIADFVQATFDCLEALFSAIESGEITQTAQVDAWAWPSNVSAVAA